MAQASSEEIFARFSPATSAWFTGAFKHATEAQLGAWDAITRDEHALVIAPTGSGKTLAAFLAALDQLYREPGGQGTKVLYISPLKALGVDVERNLRAPLIGIRQTALQQGTELPELRVGVRTGDTTARERRALQRTPPDILITTPESLFLILTSQARSMLADVHTVIIDEIHALAGTKRGTHLALSLERLEALNGRSFQRIGLSATVEPADEVARFLGGQRPVTIVRPPAVKQWDLRLCVPVPEMNAPPQIEQPSNDQEDEPVDPWAEPEPVNIQAGIWPHIEHQVVDLVSAHHASIVFANSRRLAEKVTGRLNEIWAERTGDENAILARAHHGSVAKEQRAEIEESLKSGTLRCVVATSSLELGIDMGLVDIVIQLETPPSVASGLQRVGRAGHQVGAASIGRFFPKHRTDLLHSTVLVQEMLAGRIERLSVPANPLDVLAQQTIAAVAMDDWDPEHWFDVVRRCAPYTALPRSAFDAVVDLLAGKYPSTEFAQLRPRLVWDRTNDVLSARPGGQLLAITSGGTIPDRGLFGVYLASSEESEGTGRRVGELDEEMVYESRTGEIFSLGASSWRIEQITHDRVLVTPAPGQPGKLPFWRGEGPGRHPELGVAIGKFQAALTSAGEQISAEQLTDLGVAEYLDEFAQQNLLALTQDQLRSTGAFPTDQRFIVERTTDELGDWQLILHSPYGWSVHAPWALAVAERVQDTYGFDAQVLAADDGIILRLPVTDAEPPGADLFFFDPEQIQHIVTDQLASSALFAARFRECAARALLLPRQNPTQRTPLWQQRQRSAQLLEVAQKYPQFPVMLETARECLQDVYQLPLLVEILTKLQNRSITVAEVHTASPSPLAQNLLFGYVAQYLYAGDSPLAERRAAALALDPELMQQLLGQVPLAELLEPEVITAVQQQLQRVAEDYRLTGAEGVADLLRLLGPLSAEALMLRVTDPDDLDENLAWLQARNRIFSFRLQDQDVFAVVEDAARLRDGLGIPLPHGIPVAFLEPEEDAASDLLQRFIVTNGPFTIADVQSRLGFAPAVAKTLLQRFVAAGDVQSGSFRQDVEADEYCATGVLRQLRRRSLAALRSQLAPVETSAYSRFLIDWQGVGGQYNGSDGLRQVLDQLAGYPAPASAWESLILPARVTDYQPWMLDELLSTGEVLFAGAGSTPGRDGLLSFHPSRTAPLTLPAREEEPELSADATALWEHFPASGAYFVQDLRQHLREAGVVIRDLTSALWELVFAGLLSNDSFAALRAWLGRGKNAHRVTSKPNLRSTGFARRHSIRARYGAAGTDATNPTDSFEPASAGRWSRVPEPETDPTLRGHGLAEFLLGRYGVLTGGSVKAEDVVGGFAWAYKVLSFFEDAGYCRRGYYIEHLGAAQFADLGAVDVLRSHSREEELTPLDQPAPVATTLAATDPANPYGAALPWPELAQTTHRPGRKAGALVVLVDGALALYLERGGKTMLSFLSEEQSADGALLETIAASLVGTLRAARIDKIHSEKLNQEPILGTPLAAALLAAGFYSSPSGLRFRP
ncbi:DEAD/DEAH box helicase [Micrococcoides hystricis]|uniref:DEAD/DEAH box helicase n=1 Tax=Micrococcoides hystricis TaxID=1572761 RepID=A0ABV6PAV7_9MICC